MVIKVDLVQLESIASKCEISISCLIETWELMGKGACLELREKLGKKSASETERGIQGHTEIHVI